MTREPYDPADSPAAHLDRLGESVQRDPEYRARQERIAKLTFLQRAQRRPRRLLDPSRRGPAIGLSLVVLLLFVLWVAGLIGWV